MNPTDTVDALRAIANPVRFAVLCTLREHAELTVSDLLDKALHQQFSQSALSQHLAVLRRHDLVATRRDSQRVYYSLCRERVASLAMALEHLKAA